MRMDTSDRIPVLERLSALADPTRSRLLLVLDRHELTVSELCAVRSSRSRRSAGTSGS
jgi:DNA-binding transcriptional ArsR family regulator